MTTNPEGDPTGQANPSAGRDETVSRRLAEARRRKAVLRSEQGDVSTPGGVMSRTVAVTRFLDLMAVRHIEFEMRTHHEARHARHLASMWEVGLSATVRATLMAMDGSPVLFAVPADRKIDAPGVRARMGVVAISVLRGDRGVGRVGWEGMEGHPGALPCLPDMFGASLMIDPELTGSGPIVIGLGGGQSIRCDGTRLAEACGGTVIRCVGRTRLLPEGGMVDDPPR
ncbi:MAG: hypothetical protein EXR45_08185 [Chloroflexi bacterium]|nr:hypothetical protein [Chloroflexota bacterium]